MIQAQQDLPGRTSGTAQNSCMDCHLIPSAYIGQRLCCEGVEELRQSLSFRSVPCVISTETGWELWDHQGTFVAGSSSGFKLVSSCEFNLCPGHSTAFGFCFKSSFGCCELPLRLCSVHWHVWVKCVSFWESLIGKHREFMLLFSSLELSSEGFPQWNN